MKTLCLIIYYLACPRELIRVLRADFYGPPQPQQDLIEAARRLADYAEKVHDEFYPCLIPELNRDLASLRAAAAHADYAVAVATRNASKLSDN